MRCSVCDATHDGNLTDVPWKSSRKFSVDEERPWLLVCSDCTIYADREREDLFEGDIPTLEIGWDYE